MSVTPRKYRERLEAELTICKDQGFGFASLLKDVEFGLQMSECPTYQCDLLNLWAKFRLSLIARYPHVYASQKLPARS